MEVSVVNMKLRKRKQLKSRKLEDIHKEAVILSAATNMNTTIASSCVHPIVKDGKRRKEKRSENNKREKTDLHRREPQKFRMLADLHKDTKVPPAAISSNNTTGASGCGQPRITEANPPSPEVFMAAEQLLRMSTAEYEIQSPICQLNMNPAEFRTSTARMFMRSV